MAQCFSLQKLSLLAHRACFVFYSLTTKAALLWVGGKGEGRGGGADLELVWVDLGREGRGTEGAGGNFIKHASDAAATCRVLCLAATVQPGNQLKSPAEGLCSSVC